LAGILAVTGNRPPTGHRLADCGHRVLAALAAIDHLRKLNPRRPADMEMARKPLPYVRELNNTALNYFYFFDKMPSLWLLKRGMYCYCCHRQLHHYDNHLDSILHFGCDPETGETMWKRYPTHETCAYFRVDFVLPDFCTKTMLLRQERSWPAYLLLLEIGLPLDIAWPIVAIAYWLL